MKKYSINKEYEIYAPAMACNIAENVIDMLNRGEYEDVEDAIRDELGTALIYTDDEWEMLKTYSTPWNCDYDKACQDLWDDVCRLIEDEEE